MRVLMVSDVYFPRVNGVSTSIETFRRELSGLGVEVRLVVPRYGDEADEPGIVRVAGRPVPGDREDRLAGWRRMHRAVLEAARGCDVIHVQTPFVAHYAGLAAARRLGLPVLATYHTLFEEYIAHYAPFLPAGWLRGWARGLSRRQCNALDAVVVPSRAMRQRLLDYGVARDLHVLPTGIPLARFNAGDGEAFRQRHGIPLDRLVALYVGRVAHEKNIGFLFDAVLHARQSCPGILLVVAGEGPASGELQSRAAALGLGDTVRFIGYLERRRELPDCYAAADVFAFASRTETQGLVLLEAMAAGLPVVALSEMGTADILDAGRGCVTPPDDPRRFGDVLAHLLSTPAIREQLAEDARAYAEVWSDAAMARRMADVYGALRHARTPAGAALEAGN
ncbi:glycosyltransferase [Thauera linaloolentis]|uniref:Group 1 glycosyl transferase n=1 Tax=Thauera linaloolentis (strain DSM 12138 / JCM 21573 / CCUG 41526 / CIP 105981 / IAM 15112 / NBRC 102519 / 47Lol) TaxID=1123367 RepID=N6Z633_THAL4|nr:glycosyltransferase [Thauera linaloolentis]ENO89833.1 group 1 glycosyl transferase [Thauera linaloolentis 47Lol = DSM 12138]MCM8566974.1 glycosyltransferase [Thauera linaloolentis]